MENNAHKYLRGTWGIYKFELDDSYFTLRRDSDSGVQWSPLASLNNVYHCVRASGQQVQLTNFTHPSFIGHADRFQVIPDPEFFTGDLVFLKKKPNYARYVIALNYHWQRKEVVYLVETSDTVGRVYWFAHQLEKA